MKRSLIEKIRDLGDHGQCVKVNQQEGSESYVTQVESWLLILLMFYEDSHFFQLD